MIVNGASRRSVGFWTRHLVNDTKNDRAELKEIRGLAATNLKDALLEMQEDARHTRCKNFFYQANFNPCGHETLTEEQWQRAFEIFEKHRGIPEGTARVVYEHEKDGRVHRHVIWSRINLETLKAWPDRLDAKVCHAAAREIAEELGLERTPSPYDRDREGPRPERAPKSYEMFRGMRSGLDPREVKAEVTRIYRESANAADFVNGLAEHGYRLARGDRRDFCIVDCAGDAHSLARRLDGVNAKELREFMRGIDRQALPTVEQARLRQRERDLADREADLATVRREIAWEEALARAAIEKEKAEGRFKEPHRQKEPRHREWNRMTRRIDTILQTASTDPAQRGANAKSFSAVLDSRGIGLARVTKDEAERSHRQAEFAMAVGNYAPRLGEGEIVAVTEPRPHYRRNGEIVEPRRVYKLNRDAAARFVAALDRGAQIKGVDATLRILDDRARQRALRWSEIRFGNATKNRGLSPVMGGGRAAVTAGKTAARTLGKAADFASDAFASLFAPEFTPEQKYESDRAAAQRKAEAERQVDLSRYTSDFPQKRDDGREPHRARESERDR